MTSCDHSRLTESEASESSIAQHRRNLENCQDGFGDWDRSRLTLAELGTVDLSLRERNVSNCKDGAGASLGAAHQVNPVRNNRRLQDFIEVLIHLHSPAFS
jgi:hypothetical protein